MICTNHIVKLHEIFKTKGFNEKKINTTLAKGLTTLEMRLLQFGRYYEEHLTVDEINVLNDVLDLWVYSPVEFIPFDNINIRNSFSNYGSVICNLDTIIKRSLINKYSFNSVVYVPLAQSQDNDPYSFYQLESVNAGIRHWKLDCRLEDITIYLQDSLITYLTERFRKMYFDIFSDNDYRPDYKHRCQVTECDMTRLLQNISILRDHKQINKLLRRIVRQHATHNPTKNDRFNIYSDDPLQKRNLESETEIITDANIAISLFDNIEKEHIDKFYL